MPDATPPPDPSSPFATRRGTPPPKAASPAPSPFAMKVEKENEGVAPVTRTAAKAAPIRTIPVVIAVPLIAVILAAAFYLAYPWIEKVWIAQSLPPPPEWMVRKSSASPSTTSNTRPSDGGDGWKGPGADGPSTASAPASATPPPVTNTALLPTSELNWLLDSRADAVDLIDYVRYNALTASDLSEVNQATDISGDAQRFYEASQAAEAQRRWKNIIDGFGPTAVRIGRERFANALARVNPAILREHQPGVADRVDDLRRRAEAAVDERQFRRAVALYEEAERDLAQAWRELPRLVLELLNAARSEDKAAVVQYYQQQLAELARGAQPATEAPATPIAGGTPQVTSAGSSTTAAATSTTLRFTVARDPVPPFTVLWEAERVSTSSSGVRQDRDALGGRYVCQSSPSRPLIEFGLPPGLDPITVWARYRGAPVVFESAVPGQPRREHGRTNDNTGGWEWRRIGTFPRASLGTTLSISNFNTNTWAGVDVVVLTANPGLQPQ